MQEALSREKILEDKLVNIKSMITNNIGRSQTDFQRLFDRIKQEVLQMHDDHIMTNSNFDTAAYEKVFGENVELKRRIGEGEQRREEVMQENRELLGRTKADALELATLKKACQMQKEDMLALENSVKNLQVML